MPVNTDLLFPLTSELDQDVITITELSYARKEILYFSGDGDLCAIRMGEWKITFTEMSGNLTSAWKKSPSWPFITNGSSLSLGKLLDRIQYARPGQ